MFYYFVKFVCYSHIDQALETKIILQQFPFLILFTQGLSDRQIRENVKFMIQSIYNSEIVDDSVEKWWFQSFILMIIFL